MDTYMTWSALKICKDQSLELPVSCDCKYFEVICQHRQE